MRRQGERGFTLVELLISLAVLSLIMSGLATLLIQNSQVNKQQQMTAQVQANARNTLSMVVQRLRSAGWDPTNAGIGVINLDPDLSDPISQIEVFADLDEDGFTTVAGEQVLIRHNGNQVEWRLTGNVADPFIILSTDISNDADGDGTPEPMFVPDDPAAPTFITVTITARSPAVDPVSKDFIRYTVTSDVVLRKNL